MYPAPILLIARVGRLSYYQGATSNLLQANPVRVVQLSKGLDVNAESQQAVGNPGVNHQLLVYVSVKWTRALILNLNQHTRVRPLDEALSFLGLFQQVGHTAESFVSMKAK